MTHRLEIDWMRLEEAFQISSGGMIEIEHFLDMETGEVTMISDDAVGRYLEEPIDCELPEWRRQAIQKARQIDEEYGTRYIRIPQADTREEYRDMERFIATVRNDHLRDRLRQAIRGRGAFRYFKDVLYEHPTEQERWYAFKDRCVYERIFEWLESEDIEPTNPVELPDVPEAEAGEEHVRETLLEELTLLVIYLSSWEEKLTPDLTVRRAWKGYLFEVLNELEEQGYINQTHRARSLTLTEEGVQLAQELAARYGT